MGMRIGRGKAWLAASAACLSCSTAFSQTPLGGTTPAPGASDAPPGAASETGGGLEEIIVTARRFEESLQTTPVAVTALGPSTIVNAQVVDAVNIQRVVPGLSITTGSPATSGTVYVSIRGAGGLSPGSANDPSVATYVDGVYIARPSQGMTDLIDVRRLEVLRGPQGTLFGRNTTGGALNIVNNEPTNDFEGQVRAQAGNYDYRNAGFVLNVPLVDEELAARFVYDFTDRDGFGHNATLDREANDRNSHLIRGKLAWNPGGGDWRVILSGDYNRIKDSGQFSALAAVLPTVTPTIAAINSRTPLAQFLHTKANWYTNYGGGLVNNFYSAGPSTGTNRPYNFLEAYGGSVTASGDIGGLTVKSVSALRYSFSIGLNDLDGLPEQIQGSESYYKSRQFSQELQFSGDLGDRLSYIFGGYFSDETASESSVAQSSGVVAPPPNFGYTLNLGDVRNRSTGVFGQAYYDLTEKLRLTAGLRWTWDRRKVVLHNITNIALNTCSAEITALPGFEPPCSFPRVAKYDYPAWTLGVDYRASDDIFVYARTSGASRAGGFNLRNGSATTPSYSPEKVKDVELGLKADTFGNRLRTNVALFYSWQSDVQRNASDIVTIAGIATPTQFFRNAGNQRIYGAEVELTAVPWKGMAVSANLALMRGHYEKGTFVEVRDIPGANLAGCTAVPNNPASSRCLVDRSGETVNQLPKAQYNISATQKLPTSAGELTLYANYAYIGAQTFDSQTADPRQSAAVQANLQRQIELGRVRGYGVLDGRVALRLNDPDIELFLFGKNITGNKYVLRRFNSQYAAVGTAIEFVGSPMTWGAGATFRFGPK